MVYVYYSFNILSFFKINWKNTTCVQYSGVIALHNCPGQYVTWARHPASLSFVSSEAGTGTTASSVDRAQWAQCTGVS